MGTIPSELGQLSVMKHLHLGKIFGTKTAMGPVFLHPKFRLNHTDSRCLLLCIVIIIVILVELNELAGTLPTELGGLTAAEYVRLCT